MLSPALCGAVRSGALYLRRIALRFATGVARHVSLFCLFLMRYCNSFNRFTLYALAIRLIADIVRYVAMFCFVAHGALGFIRRFESGWSWANLLCSVPFCALLRVCPVLCPTFHLCFT